LIPIARGLRADSLDYTSRLPAETLRHIFRLGTGLRSGSEYKASRPFGGEHQSERVIFDCTMASYSGIRYFAQRSGDSELNGPYYYKTAYDARLVCRKWLEIIKQDQTLQFLLMSFDFDRNPVNKFDPNTRQLISSRPSGNVLEEKYMRCLELAERFRGCDILLFTSHSLWPEHDEGMSSRSTTKAADIFTQYPDRVRILQLYLQQDQGIDEGCQRILLALFGGHRDRVNFPRLEYASIFWDNPGINEFAPQWKHLLIPTGEGDNLPKLESLETSFCPWYVIENPSFRFLRYLSLAELGDCINSTQPLLWQMVNSCANLECLNLNWDLTVPIHNIPVQKEQHILTIPRLTILTIELPDRMVWPILANVRFPGLQRLGISLVGQRRNMRSLNAIPGRANRPELSFHWPKLLFLEISSFYQPVAEFLSCSGFSMLDELIILNHQPMVADVDASSFSLPTARGLRGIQTIDVPTLRTLVIALKSVKAFIAVLNKPPPVQILSRANAAGAYKHISRIQVLELDDWYDRYRSARPKLDTSCLDLTKNQDVFLHLGRVILNIRPAFTEHNEMDLSPYPKMLTQFSQRHAPCLSSIIFLLKCSEWSKEKIENVMLTDASIQSLVSFLASRFANGPIRELWFEPVKLAEPMLRLLRPFAQH
jgi:hypothetical protein